MSDMTEKRLTKWLEAGYPYLKAGSGLPAWLLPERSLNSAADKLGDSGILQMSQPLDLAKGIVPEQLPDPASFSSEAWQRAVKQWPPLSQVRPVIEAFLEISGRVMVQFRCIRAKVDPMVICHSLAVLLFAPFLAEGRPVVEEVACILGRDASRPAELITGYAEAVISGDTATVEKVNGCILRYSIWAEWAAAVEEEALRCQSNPRLIAVIPPLSSELTNVLALMIKEAQYDEP